jgi:DNA-binding LacI/PurR family transcriptional regulator
MTHERRVTQRDIAERAGVHRSTVSMVFKNHAGIPAKTRERVLKIAEEMGYSPDPMLSALAIYRVKQRPSTYHGTLAWLVNSESGFDWEKIPVFRQYFEGASLCAKRHGFLLHVFDINAAKMTPKRLAGILKARNVSGIQVCPQPNPCSVVDFDWEHFSAISLGYSLINPVLHTVSAAHYRNVGQTLAELNRRGYERVGLVVYPEFDRRVDDSFLSRYVGDQYVQYGTLPIPPLLASYNTDMDALKEWLDGYRPEAIVVSDGQDLKGLAGRLEKIGYKVPADIGVACAGLASRETGVSGVYETPLKIGEAATDLLVSMIHRGERGVPKQPQRVHIEGEWMDASSLKAHSTE